MKKTHDDALQERRDEDPNPAVAFAVGLIYVFRTSAGARIMRELETAVRKYSADPQALWRLVREGGGGEPRSEVIDTTAAAQKGLESKKK
ncbi:MAG TPA: hypothetical protein VGL86_13340 [Polyangia bacterium]|jgi:hypothetical protein